MTEVAVIVVLAVAAFVGIGAFCFVEWLDYKERARRP